MSVNDITGDPIRTDVPSDKFKTGWDAIWGKLEEVIEAVAKDAGDEPVTDEDVLKECLWGDKTTDDVQKILDTPSVAVPFGLSRKELREFIMNSAQESSTQFSETYGGVKNYDHKYYCGSVLDVTSEEDEAWKEMERK